MVVTRAIHLELVESMDTDSFINALQRFISRRGKPNTIISNFKGAVKELKLEHSSLNQMQITEFTERQVQVIQQHFWQRWVKEYLPTLTKRVKWHVDDKSVKIGDPVLLREGNVKRGPRPLGRVEQVYPWQDGIVHLLNVRTKTRVYVRPVLEIYPLEECYVDEVPQGGGNVTKSTSDSRT